MRFATCQASGTPSVGTRLIPRASEQVNSLTRPVLLEQVAVVVEQDKGIKALSHSVRAKAEQCPFCRAASQVASPLYNVSPKALVVEDNFPVTPGHVLVVSHRHTARLSDLSRDEATELWRLVSDQVRKISDQEGVDGVTIGVNDGAAAGQTIAHVHVHLIPRRYGDVPDPRGGVRWVVPDTAQYWSQ